MSLDALPSKLNTMLDCNIISLGHNNEDQKDEAKRLKANEKSKNEQIFKLKENMENPENHLDIDSNLTVVGDDKDKVIDIKERVCLGLAEEEESIKEELRMMKQFGVKARDILEHTKPQAEKVN